MRHFITTSTSVMTGFTFPAAELLRGNTRASTKHSPTFNIIIHFISTVYKLSKVLGSLRHTGESHLVNMVLQPVEGGLSL